MPIRHKRAALARAMAGSGLLGAIERLARRPGLVVLCYHRIGEAGDDPYYSPLVSATPGALREQVRALRDRYRLLRLDEAVGLIGEGLRDLREPCALVTFDDGYRDNLEAAVPILRQQGVPAAFFLTTAFLDGALPWWDRVAFMIKRSNVARLQLDRPEPIDVDLGGDRAAALGQVIAAFWRSARPDDPEAMAHLSERAECSAAGDAARSLMLDWDAARRLAALGPDYALGAHTLTHPRLSGLSIGDQATQLSDSKRRLERELGRSIDAVAYPYGLASDFDATTRRLAVEAGYRAGFALTPGVNRPGATDPMAVARLAVGPADSPAMVRARVALTTAAGRSPL